MINNIDSHSSSAPDFKGRFIRLGKMDAESRTYISKLLRTKTKNDFCLQSLKDKPFDVYIKNISNPKQSGKNLVFFTNVFKDNDHFFSFVFIKNKNLIENNAKKIKNFIQRFHSDVYNDSKIK